MEMLAEHRRLSGGSVGDFTSEKTQSQEQLISDVHYGTNEDLCWDDLILDERCRDASVPCPSTDMLNLNNIDGQ